MHLHSLKQLTTATRKTLKVGDFITRSKPFTAYAAGESQLIPLKQKEFLIMKILTVGEHMVTMQATKGPRASREFRASKDEMQERDPIETLIILCWYMLANLVTLKYFKKNGLSI